MVSRLKAKQIRQIVDLAKKGVSIAQIAEATGKRKSTVYYHARNYCRKMTTLNLDLLDETEKGYILGLFLGDGSFNKGFKQRRYVVRFALDVKRDQDIAGRLAEILDKGHKKISVFHTGSTLTAKVCSKELEQYVRVYIDYRPSEEGTNEKTLF